MEIKRKARSVKVIRKDFRGEVSLSLIVEDWVAYGFTFGEMHNIVYRNLVEIKNQFNKCNHLYNNRRDDKSISVRLGSKNCDDSQL